MVFPFPSFFRAMGRWLNFAGGMWRVIAPQLLLSGLAMFAYVQAGLLPLPGVALHLCGIALLQVSFYSCWGLVVRFPFCQQHRGLKVVFAGCQLLKGLLLNGIYLTSFGTYQLWHAYLTWENLKVSTLHLEGFRQSFGAVIPAALAGLILLAGLSWWLGYRFSTETFRLLAVNHRKPAQGRFTLALTGSLALVLTLVWLFEPNTSIFLSKDPVYAFWQPNQLRDLVPTPAMLVEQRAADFTPPPQFQHRNVIVVTIDCLRRDHLSLHGYERETMPFLTSLHRAGQAPMVSFSVAQSNYSPQGIRSVLSSRLPHQQLPFTFKIQDALKRCGYRTHLIAAGDHTTLLGMRKHYGSNFDVFHDGTEPGNFSMNDDRKILDRLRQLPASDGRPAFFYFHLMSAHGLGIRRPEYQKWQPSALVLDVIPLLSGHYEPVLMRNTYDNGLAQADHYLEEIFAILREKGYLQNYIGAITGDHGESLGERGHFGHTGYLYMEDIGVPLFFVESAPIEYGPMPFGGQIDIAPTLLARLGLPRPRQWQGQSLFQSPPPLALYAETLRKGEDWKVVIQKQAAGIYKLFQITESNGPSREMLFNLSTDPQETLNLLAAPVETEILGQMRPLLQWKETPSSTAP